MTFIKREVEWLKQHARRDEDGAWWCKETGAPIQVAEVGRSIHFSFMPGAGSGEVRSVTHLACGKCDVGKVPPKHGTPINDNELVENF